ncbi:cytidine deaminase [Devosia sp.]|uniref:cytidine deaminase n=1 Tax=Devosia sp. TaxID=1871048 RepID=UPI003A8C9FB4
MSGSPFAADPARAARVAELSARHGNAVAEALSEAARSGKEALVTNSGGVVSAADAADIASRFALEDVEEVMLVGLAAARAFAFPPISDFHVGAIGREAGTGDLILGGNMEFAGTHLGTTVHGEGFVFSRAFSRGQRIDTIALGEAHPCGHCRQYLSEFAGADQLKLIDLLGHRLDLAQLYPWPFDTAYLGEPGAVAGRVNWRDLRFVEEALDDLSDVLLETGRRAHAPYSKCPAAVVLDLADGARVAGATIESVAFNPTMPPLQAALIDVRAHGYAPDAIVAATLGATRGGAVDHVPGTEALLATVAPGVTLTVRAWEV